MSNACVIRRANTKWPARGEWAPRVVGGTHTAAVCCPQCGLIGGLDSHAIAEDGAVTPSVQCPTMGCSFHEYVRLADYVRTTP